MNTDPETALAHLASRCIRIVGSDWRIIDAIDSALGTPTINRAGRALSAGDADQGLQRHWMKISRLKNASEMCFAIATSVPAVTAMFERFCRLDRSDSSSWRHLLASLPGACTGHQARFLGDRERALFLPCRLFVGEEFRARVAWSDHGNAQ